ncbi:MAG: 30S ribosomal protein S3 [Candidatus Saccharibacteria bacterium]
MGQKVNPISLRLSVTKNWSSKWFGGKDFRSNLISDIKIRELISKKLAFRSGLASIEIERSTGQIIVTIFTSKPGVVIGRGGAGVEALKTDLKKLIGQDMKLNIEEVKSPETNAQLIAENVASQLERRMAFRRVIKGAVDNSMKSGMLGTKITVAGRLNGAEMARTESASQGSIPLHTIKANIEYGTARAQTTYGIIGVKVWVYKG